MRPVTSLEALESLLESGETALVFKHSTRCPISARALLEVKRFTSARPDVPVYLLKVIEDRPVSLRLAERIGVRHESPQAILLRGGRAVWHGSHDRVTVDELDWATTVGAQVPDQEFALAR
jgi:bacillithiol system protein YtxJ